MLSVDTFVKFEGQFPFGTLIINIFCNTLGATLKHYLFFSFVVLSL